MNLESLRLVEQLKALPHGAARMRSGTVIVAGTVLAWMVCNALTAESNRVLFDIMGYRFPALLGTCQMIAAYTMSGIFLAFKGGTAPETKAVQPICKDRATTTKSMRPWTREGAWVVPAAYCSSIVLNDFGLKYVFPSFFKALSACTTLVTMLLAVLVQGKRYHAHSYFSMVPLGVGVVACTVTGDLEHTGIGALCCGTAVVLNGVRSVAQDMLVHNCEGGALSPMRLLFYMSRQSILILSTWCMITERSRIMEDPKTYLPQTWAMISVSSTLAVGIHLATLLITFYTSAVTLQVLVLLQAVASGIFSVAVWHGQVPLRAIAGACATVVGVMLYTRAPSSDFVDPMVQLVRKLMMTN